MPTTRSQTGTATRRVMEDARLRTFEGPPASPSVQASDVTPQAEMRHVTAESGRTEANIATTATEEATEIRRDADADAPMTRPPSSRCSSAAARIRQAELLAEEKLVALKRKEMELEANLIKRRLAFEIATIEETDDDRESVPAGVVRAKVDDWLDSSQSRCRGGETQQPATESEDVSALRDERNRHVFTRQREKTARNEEMDRNRPHLNSPMSVEKIECAQNIRQQDADCYAGPHENMGGVERLAVALERILSKRPAPRQTLELPTFNGSPTDWLPFRAAMEESTRMCNFSKAENMARLRNCLKGEAREAVAALLACTSDPSTIMKTLEQCFGRPEVIIDRALSDLKNLPRLGATAGELNAFAIKVQNIVTTLESMDNRGYLRNPMLTREVVEKLSPHLKSRWCDYAARYISYTEPEIVTLSHYLMEEATKAVRYAYAPQTSNSNAKKEVMPVKQYGTAARKKSTGVYAVAEEKPATQQEKVCLCCGSDHDVTQCKKLAAMTTRQRWDWVKQEKICFLCLNSKHRRFKCKAQVCKEDDCGRRHHRLLHIVGAKSQQPVNPELVASVNHSTDASKVLLKVCPIEIEGPRGRVSTYALLDEGSTVTLIDQNLAEYVGASGPVRDLHICSVNAQGVTHKSMEVEVRVLDSDKECHVLKARTMENLVLNSQTIDRSCLNFEHLRELKQEDVCYVNARPRVLIGADNWHLIVSRKLLTGKRRQPVASLTKLGWVIHGLAPYRVIREKDTVLFVDSKQRKAKSTETLLDDDLHDMVKQHFEIDSLGITKKERENPEDVRAVEAFKSTVKRNRDRYEVGLPWREDDIVMPPSYDQARRRLVAIESKMDKSTEFKERYTAQMNNMFEKCYAEESLDTDTESQRLWYLPHFAVINVNKPGKLRLVFDAAAKSNGVCLNDALLEGPDLLRDLAGMLFRFRERAIAVTADIKEMFLQVKIRKEDQPAQMFLWRGDDRTSPPKIFKMTSMIFGAKSSPFLAHSVRDHNAEEYAAVYPRAHEAITKNHYMDDWVDCFDTEQEASDVIKEVIHVHAQAGFMLTAFNSNRADVLHEVPLESRATSPKQLGASTDQYGRTLGLIWDANADKLSFNTALVRVPPDVKTLERTPTKREALSAVMSIFDPLGLLSYYTIRAKILMQQVWRLQTGWDEDLPQEIAEDFSKWLGGVEAFSSLRLPRLYSRTGGVTRKQLHVFCDASETAYATAIYWMVEYEDGSRRAVLAAAKARVAPMKAQTIPRLELQACLIGARLASTIIREHRWQPDRVTYWTDSRTVLHWIGNDRVRYTPYVAHRLREISELTHPNQWRWVPTQDNVADDATRIVDDVKCQDDRWFIGPSFLYENEELWPSSDVANDSDDEGRYDEVHNVTTNNGWSVPVATRFSNHERIVRAMAYVLLFIDKCRRRAKDLSVEHIRKAETWLVRRAQAESFGEELDRLRKGQNLKASSRIRNLDPCIDEEGVLRARGRTGAAGVSAPDTTPVILDGSHPYARLLCDREHRRAHHSHNERVVNDLRQRYWILRLRPAVRAVAYKCAFCRMRKTKPVTPVIGDLPRARLEAFTKPFSNCGLDFFGPMTVTIGRRHEKRWGALFTCLTTRAVHIELVASLSTDSAIMALRRMGARRGWPQVMYSDNATNFKGADSELRAATTEWEPILRDFALTQRIDWRYISPGAPHQGGAWERMIRSVKNALRITLNEKSPKEEVLHTLLVEVEYTLNARPLTHVPVSASDPEALTPNHFLLGGSYGPPITGPCEQASRKTWRAAQALADEYWRRWLKEYLPELIPRRGARDVNEIAIKPGDLVIVVDHTLPRNVWPRGVVTAVHPGPDGGVRNVEIRTKGGVFRRPTSRLAVLPVEREEGAALRSATPGGECNGQAQSQ